MKTSALYDTKGMKKGEAALPENVFDVPSNDVLLHQVYVAIAGNRRANVADTKSRGERQGSGKKPWKQKGTGRARIGSIRAPHWRKGGVVFGPTTDRNFEKRTNKSMRRKATTVALSEKFRADKLRVIDGFSFESEKTKSFAQMLTGLGIAGKSTLTLFTPEELSARRLARNIPRVTDTLAENVSVYDLLNAEYLILTPKSVEALTARFTEEAEATGTEAGETKK